MCQAQTYSLEQPPQPLAQQERRDYLPLHPPRSGQQPGLLGTDGFDIYPRLGAGAYYDDNITLSENDRLDDWVGVIAPGLTFVAGETTGAGFGAADIRAPAVVLSADRGAVANSALASTGRGFSLDYLARVNFYAHNSSLNAVDHVGRLNFVYPWPRLLLRLQQDVAVLSESPIDAATRQRNRNYFTSINADYRVSDLTSWQSTLNQTITDYEDGIGSRDWQGSSYLNYAVTPTISSGAGFVAGLTDADSSPLQYYEQVRFRFGYVVTELIHVDASAGFEWRQFDSPESGSSGLVFDLSGTYAPTERTHVTLSAGRNNQNSAVQTGQNYTDTTATLSLNQAIGSRWSGVVRLSYHNLSYSDAGTGVQSSRRDDYFSLQFGLGMALTPRVSLSGFYQFRRNASTEATSEYRNNQTGLALIWAY